MKYQARKTWRISTTGRDDRELLAALQGIENQDGEVFSIIPNGIVGYMVIYYTTEEQSVIRGFKV